MTDPATTASSTTASSTTASSTTDSSTTHSSTSESNPHHHLFRRVTRLTAAVALAGAVAAGPAWADNLAPCPDAGHAAFLDGELPKFSAALNQGRPLRIVAIGSSSTAGAGATSAAQSYPSQLESDLTRRFPGHEIDVVNVGVNGQEAPDMLARLDVDVLQHSPDLVIWQFGSNGLMRGRPLEEMETAARIGIDRINRAGAEVMLMDLQHAPRIDGLAARDEVLRMMERVSDSTGAALFHRYRIMRAWATTLGGNYAQMLSADQLHMTDTSYRCLASAVAAGMQVAVNRATLAAAARNGGNLARAAVRFPVQRAGAASAP